MKLRLVLGDTVMHTFKELKKIDMYGDKLILLDREGYKREFMISMKVRIEVLED